MPPINSLRKSRIKEPIMRQKARKMQMPPQKANRRLNPMQSEQRMTEWKDQYSPPETTNIIRAVFIEFQTM